MENVEKQIKEVCRRFGIQGEYGRFEVIESGHINSTYKVFFFSRRRMEGLYRTEIEHVRIPKPDRRDAEYLHGNRIRPCEN